MAKKDKNKPDSIKVSQINSGVIVAFKGLDLAVPLSYEQAHQLQHRLFMVLNERESRT